MLCAVSTESDAQFFTIRCPDYPSQVASDIRLKIEAAAGRVAVVKAAEAGVEFERGARDLWAGATSIDALVMRATELAAYCQFPRSSGIPDAEKLDRWERFNAQKMGFREPSPTPPTRPTQPEILTNSATGREASNRSQSHRAVPAPTSVVVPRPKVMVEISRLIPQSKVHLRAYKRELSGSEQTVYCSPTLTTTDSLSIKLPRQARVLDAKAKWNVVSSANHVPSASTSVLNDAVTASGFIVVTDSRERGLSCGKATLHLNVEYEADESEVLPPERLFLGTQTISRRARFVADAENQGQLFIRLSESASESSEIEVSRDMTATRPSLVSLGQYTVIVYMDRRDLVVVPFRAD